jgi:hypothetical protein
MSDKQKCIILCALLAASIGLLWYTMRLAASVPISG